MSLKGNVLMTACRNSFVFVVCGVLLGWLDACILMKCLVRFLRFCGLWDLVGEYDAGSLIHFCVYGVLLGWLEASILMECVVQFLHFCVYGVLLGWLEASISKNVSCNSFVFVVCGVSLGLLFFYECLQEFICFMRFMSHSECPQMFCFNECLQDFIVFYGAYAL